MKYAHSDILGGARSVHACRLSFPYPFGLASPSRPGSICLRVLFALLCPAPRTLFLAAPTLSRRNADRELQFQLSPLFSNNFRTKHRICHRPDAGQAAWVILAIILSAFFFNPFREDPDRFFILISFYWYRFWFFNAIQFLVIFFLCSLIFIGIHSDFFVIFDFYWTFIY